MKEKIFEFKQAPKFYFGAATSSFQIEGAPFEDGKGPSIWDVYCKERNTDSPEVACDHYHRYKDDVKLMKKIGLEAYRFSISWPRIFPKKGEYNPLGMKFYKKLVKELKANGIEPFATLNHWDCPQWFYEEGGWANRENIKYFLDYANKLFDELDGQVTNWMTHNEPWVMSILNYGSSQGAPGHRNINEVLAVAHNLLLSHGMCVRSLRKRGSESKIGIVLNLHLTYPSSDKFVDKIGAKLATEYYNDWFLAPLFKKEYPIAATGTYMARVKDWSFIHDGDFDIISSQMDFLGVNMYSATFGEYQPMETNDVNNIWFAPNKGINTNRPKNTIGWESDSIFMYDLINYVRANYTDIPIFITENGGSFDEEIKNNVVYDIEREHYIMSHLLSIARLNEQGKRVDGYFVWSLMDNFEWGSYNPRFGIIRVDYNTQKRTLKNSAKAYSKLIATRKLSFQVPSIGDNNQKLQSYAIPGGK